MANAPVTSITLLKGLSSGTDNARWAEFFRIYEQPMRSFLQSRFPTVDADDAIQETMVALTLRMPDYHYTPDRNGHFHNYLTGILKHKAYPNDNNAMIDEIDKSKKALDGLNDYVLL